MSGLYDDIFIQEHTDDEDLQPKPTLISSVVQDDETAGKTSASRSIADDIVDAVAGVPQRKPVRTRTCSCGSTEFRKISPYGGGTSSLKCVKCKQMIPLASIQNRDARMTQRNTQSTGAGPYRRAPRDPVERTNPTFRIASEIQNDET